jgi:hypothetical protein
MADLKDLHAQIMARKDFKPFYISQGITFPDRKPDDNGFMEGCGCGFLGGAPLKIHVESGAWRETVTGQFGNIYQFVMKQHRLQESEVAQAMKILCDFYKIDFEGEQDVPGVWEAAIIEIENFEKQIPPIEGIVLERMRDSTGILLKTIRKYKLGWIESRGTKPGIVAIPILNPEGLVCGVRGIDENLDLRWIKRMPNGEKLEQTTKLFGSNELVKQNWETVIVCNNELDRMLLMQERNDENIGAVSITDGYSPLWNPLFEGRNVIVIFSADAKSVKFAQSGIGPIIEQMKKEGKVPSLKVISVGCVGTPDDRYIYHWFKRGNNWDNLKAQTGWAPEYVQAGTKDPNSGFKVLESLGEIDERNSLGHRVRVKLTVTGESSVVYDSTTKFEVEHCSEVEKGKCNKCPGQVFDVTLQKPGVHIEVNNSNDHQVNRMLRDVCCPYSMKPKIKKLEYATFREIVATQYAERRVERDPSDDPKGIFDGKVERIVEKKLIYQLPAGAPPSIDMRGYWANGTVLTNPKNQARTMLIESLEPISEEYETFNYQQHIDGLRFLKTLGWRGICDDLIEHRTHLFNSDGILITNLLTFCSPLHLSFNGEPNMRGWIAAIVMGDTGIGKSRTYEKISEMIGIGDIFSCESGRRTGLTFNVQHRNDGYWKVEAGLHPLNSRKILLVEEAQAMSAMEIGALGIALDKGVLKVDFVAKGSFESKTRMIFNCNPMLGKPLDFYPQGVLSLRDIFIPSFLRRIDIAIVSRKLEDTKEYNKPVEPKGEPRVTRSLLRALVFYAWNITPDRVIFSKEVTRHVLTVAQKLIDIYGFPDDITLVYPSDFRKTIARLAAAWAVLDMSSNDDMKTITVTQDHVNLVFSLINKIYSDPDCGLDRYSDQWRRSRSLEDYKLIEVEMKVRLSSKSRAALSGINAMAIICAVMSKWQSVKRAALPTIGGMDEGSLSQNIQVLIFHNMISQEKDGKIRATAKFHRFMKRFEHENPLEAGILRQATNLIEHSAKGKEEGKTNDTSKVESGS